VWSSASCAECGGRLPWCNAWAGCCCGVCPILPTACRRIHATPAVPPTVGGMLGAPPQSAVAAPANALLQCTRWASCCCTALAQRQPHTFDGPTDRARLIGGRAPCVEP
jgi:hypothetical protein